MTGWGLARFAGLGASPSAMALPGVYMWVDAAGQVHCDDQRVAEGPRHRRARLAASRVPPANGSGLTVPEERVELFARQSDPAPPRITTLQAATAGYGISPGGCGFRDSVQQGWLMVVVPRSSASRHCPGGAARAADRAALDAARRRTHRAQARE